MFKDFFTLQINKIKNILIPPSMIEKQALSVFLFSYLLRWRKLPEWFFKHSFKSIQVAAGAIGMGCIGFPNHPVLEITSRCNLKCIHCHAGNINKNSNNFFELSTSQVKNLIDDIRKVNEFRMIVFTGGEPFVRDDLIEILEYSKYKGFVNVIATNATLITDEIAKKIKKAGVAGIAVSLDSTNPAIHNEIRQNKNAFELALAGIEAVKKAGILLQINTTAMEYNFNDLQNLIKLADNLGSSIMLMYQLVPVGRGCLIKNASLNINSNRELIEHVANIQRNVSVIVETVAGPQYWPYLIESFLNNNFDSKNFDSIDSKYFDSKYSLNIKYNNHDIKKNNKKVKLVKRAQNLFHGCTAGRGLVYIKSNGDVWPCPFLELSSGNVLEKPFNEIWENSKVFSDLRNRKNLLKGKCGNCEYNEICGGCRGRAYALSRDYLSEDPYCFIENGRVDK